MQLHHSWKLYLSEEMKKTYMQSLFAFLKSDVDVGKKIYPKQEDIFAAFECTPFDEVRVVIIGQDPYHGEGQAHGLSFSIKPGIKMPPSLVNIFKELQKDLGTTLPKDGSLIPWAKQGVLMLNSVLTVEHGKAGSHHKRGWEQFTDKVIEILNEKKRNLVFILWGSPAQKKAAHVDEKKHLVIRSPHPSPLSSYRGFFGSRPFSKTNAYLKQHELQEIQWM